MSIKKPILKTLWTWVKFIPLAKLFSLSSGATWDEVEKSLFDFNTTVITLSSSALIFSFSVIGFSNIHINKTLLASGWILFLITITAGIVVLYLKFIARMADRILKARSEKNEYKKGEMAFDIYEFRVYFWCLVGIFFLSMLEMLSFIFALGFLILTAYYAIK